MTRCPNGHFTSATEHCDICGAPLDAAGATASGGTADGTASGGPGSSEPGAPGPSTTVDALREPAGTAASEPDATSDPGSGSQGDPREAEDESGLPDVPTPPAVRPWVVEVWVDPAWYAESQSPDPVPTAGPPRTVVLRGRSALVGRPSASRNIDPDVDCSSDSGVSRRHAQLTSDGTRFFVEDLESANGTFVGPAGGRLPADPVEVGVQHELGPDDRVYLGAWTRLVVRSASEDEQA